MRELADSLTESVMNLGHHRRRTGPGSNAAEQNPPSVTTNGICPRQDKCIIFSLFFPKRKLY